MSATKNIRIFFRRNRSVARIYFYFLKSALRTSPLNKKPLVIGSQSQAAQESFVYRANNCKKSGTYVEIGGHDGFTMSNTLLLESRFSWVGVAIEFDAELCSLYNAKRKNSCLELDATTADYQEILTNFGFPKQIDYLQVDIDPSFQSLQALKKVLSADFRFSIITFEHDAYLEAGANSKVLIESRKLLHENHYELVASRVCHEGKEFEDWWIDPKVVPDRLIKDFRSNSKEGRSHFSVWSQFIDTLNSVNNLLKANES